MTVREPVTYAATPRATPGQDAASHGSGAALLSARRSQERWVFSCSSLPAPPRRRPPWPNWRRHQVLEPLKWTWLGCWATCPIA